MIVDLSHVFEDGMPGARFKGKTGETVELTAHIRPYMTHAQSRRHYDGKASFEISDVAFQSSVGTKMDAPRHRFEGTKLCEARIALFGVDCSNVDSTQDAERPAHTLFLSQGILIVENLTSLSHLRGQRFRFFSIPLKARDAAAFPVRAFAEVRE